MSILINKFLNKFILFTTLNCVLFFTFTFCNKIFAEEFFLQSSYKVPQGMDMLLAPSSKIDYTHEWFSQDENIATIDNKGVVHGKKLGICEIIAKNKKNNQISKCMLEVMPPKPIRVCYCSEQFSKTNSTFEAITITQEPVKKIKFEIKCGEYNKIYYCTNSRQNDSVRIWKQKINIPVEGKATITAYASENSYDFLPDSSSSTVLIRNSFDIYEISVLEKSVSQKCINFIASCEKFIRCIYVDSAGFLTIGYGKKLNSAEAFYNNITREEAVAILHKTINQNYYVRCINNFLITNKIKFNQHQFDALVSFCYNLGCSWIINGSDLKNIIVDCGNSDSHPSYAFVNSDNGLFVRSLPSTSGKKYCVLKNKERIEILSLYPKNEHWYKIKTSSGIIGYCCSDFLDIKYECSSEKKLKNINKEKFIKEFSAYHHASHKCLKGLISRRFQELDMFFYGDYSRFNSKKIYSKRYNIPDCAKDLI